MHARAHTCTHIYTYTHTYAERTQTQHLVHESCCRKLGREFGLFQILQAHSAEKDLDVDVYVFLCNVGGVLAVEALAGGVCRRLQ